MLSAVFFGNLVVRLQCMSQPFGRVICCSLLSVRVNNGSMIIGRNGDRAMQLIMAIIVGRGLLLGQARHCWGSFIEGLKNLFLRASTASVSQGHGCCCADRNACICVWDGELVQGGVYRAVISNQLKYSLSGRVLPGHSLQLGRSGVSRTSSVAQAFIREGEFPAGATAGSFWWSAGGKYAFTGPDRARPHLRLLEASA